MVRGIGKSKGRGDRRETGRGRSVAVSATLALGALVGLGACSAEEPTSSAPPPAPAAAGSPGSDAVADEADAAPAVATATSQAELVARGRAVWMSNCIACHAQDPNVDGALGPAVAGSSYELLEARVVHGTYPPGYKPKRESGIMIALPHLENDIGALEAFLNQ